MKKLIYISFILILASCVNSSERFRLRAERLMDEGRYVEASVLFDRAIKRNPRNILALNNRGVNKSLLGDYAGAIEDYSRVIEIHSDNTLALFNRGKSKARLGYFHSAIEDLSKALETVGGERDSFIRFIPVDNIFLRVKVCPFNVESERIRLERGVARYNLGYFQEAREDINYAIRWGFNLPLSYYVLGWIYLVEGDFDLACQMLFQAFLHRHPDAIEILNEYCMYVGATY